MEVFIHQVVVVFMVVAEEVSKDYLRNCSFKLRKQIVNKETKEEKIREKILNNNKVIETKNILVYVSKKYEIDTFKLIEELWNLNKNVYAPKVEGNNLKFYKIKTFNDLEIGNFHLLEPNTNEEYIENKDTIIVPGLMFDKSGNRLGYGKGFYDRYLKDKNIYKIGICFSTMYVDKIKIDKFDIKMDEVITE